MFRIPAKQKKSGQQKKNKNKKNMKSDSKRIWRWFKL